MNENEKTALEFEIEHILIDLLMKDLMFFEDVNLFAGDFRCKTQNLGQAKITQ